MSSLIEIVIADAQPIFRIGLRKVLEEADRFKVIGEASDGEAAIEMINDLKPSIAILSVDLPKKDGFEVARTILVNSLPVDVILLTSLESGRDFDAALNPGVKGCLLKTSPSSFLIDAVKAIGDAKKLSARSH